MSESELPQPRFSTRLPLPLVLFWGLSPALLMTLSGLLMEWHAGRGLSEGLLLVGLLGGPVILLFWSARILWPVNIEVLAKALLVVPITIVACVVNLFLAAGACSLFEPPFLH